VLLALLAAMGVHALRAGYRHEAALGHERAVLASAKSELELTKARADTRTFQLEAMLAGTSDGVAVIDGDMQLVEWNPRFAEIAGVAAAVLRVGLPVAEIVRAQAEAGMFGNVDVVAEVTRQVAALRTGDHADTVVNRRSDGRMVERRVRRLLPGGIVMLYRDISRFRAEVSPLSEAPVVAEAAKPPRPVQQAQRRLPRTRILLVEDHRADRLVTADSLRREGHLVDVAGNGSQAITAAVAQPYDLILMDLALPDMSGLEATRQLRGLNGPAAAVPIIALAASTATEDYTACEAAGMNAMLAGTVSPQALFDTIAQHVWRRRSEPVRIALSEAPVAPPAILSSVRLDELRATLPADTLANLVEECLLDLSERLASLQETLRQQSLDQARLQADAMARVATEYGMTALEIRLRALVQAIGHSPDAVAVLARQLDAELFDAATALRAALDIEMV
jgi:CheY-like chemotaxis protein/PAS domain-containing protein